jgi:CysZ protein
LTPTQSLAAAVAGFRLPFEGARLLVGRRRLWAPALVPALLWVGAFVGAVSALIAHAGWLYAGLTDWLPVLAVPHPLAWLWIGPAKLALWLFGALLFLGFAGLCVIAALLLAGLLASPFHDVLSARVEEIVAGTARRAAGPAPAGWLRAAFRALREELRRIAFYASLAAPIAALGWLVPPAQIVTAPALLGITLVFLPLDGAGPCLDRQGRSFHERRRWLFANLSTMLGFGSAALLLCMIPGANLVAMPMLIVGGTLLAIRHPV